MLQHILYLQLGIHTFTWLNKQREKIKDYPINKNSKQLLFDLCLL